jgi:hypothetical protein
MECAEASAIRRPMKNSTFAQINSVHFCSARYTYVRQGDREIRRPDLRVAGGLESGDVVPARDFPQPRGQDGCLLIPEEERNVGGVLTKVEKQNRNGITLKEQ